MSLPLVPLLLATPALHAQESDERPQALSIVVVPIRGKLDSTMLSLVRRGAGAARERKAAGLVIEIDTEGGEIELMWEIARTIDEAKGVPSIAFITHRAWSAGALVALACEKIYASPGASIGAAMPVAVGPTGIVPVEKEVRPKIVSALRADFRSRAEAHGRNPRLAEAMVDTEVELKEVLVEGERKILLQDEVDDLRARGTPVDVLQTLCSKGQILSLTAAEALRLQFIDGLAADRPELLQVLGLPGAEVVELRITWSESFAKLLRDIGPVLFIAGCVLAYIEMKMAGFGVAGILSIASFGLLLFGNYLAGLADFFEILLVLAGFILIAVELFVLPGSLLFGILGSLCVIAGLLLSFQNFVVPRFDMDWEILRRNASSLALSLLAAVVLVVAVARYLPWIPLVGRLVLRPPAPSTGSAAMAEADAAGLVGARGRAVTDLRPAGKVEVSGRLLDAQTGGDFIGRGAAVRVLEVGANRVVVEKVA